MATIRSSRAIARSLERVTSQSTARTSIATARLLRQAIFASKHNSAPSSSRRSFSVLTTLKESGAASAYEPVGSGISPPKSYSFEEVQDLTSSPSKGRVLIDVREPSELLQTGRIPTAKSVPISSAPDAFFMNEEDFETKFGFPRPSDKDEVIFYCKAGVRSRQAALLAQQARPVFGGKVGNYQGSWLDWEKNGGKVEKEGEQGEESSVSGVTNPGQAVPGTPRP